MRHTFSSSINRPGDLDLLPTNQVRIITRRLGNLPTNFDISGTFCSSLIGQNLSDGSCDLATLTINIGGHGAFRWYGSSFSICVLSFKFVGVSVRKIWRSSSLNISRPGDLETGAPYNCPWGGQNFYQFRCFWGFAFSTFGPTPFRHCVTLQPWPLTFDVIALVSDMRLRSPSV